MKWSLVILLIAGLNTSGCHREKQTQAGSAELPIEQITRDPHRYAHQLLTVRGCYQRGFELSLLRPCSDVKYGDLVWVDSAESASPAWSTKGQSTSRIPKELQRRPAQSDNLVFQYDEAQSDAAWAKLNSVAGLATPVVVRGQFDTAEPNTGFGHLGQYEHRLILVEVFEVYRWRLQRMVNEKRETPGVLIIMDPKAPFRGGVPDANFG